MKGIVGIGILSLLLGGGLGYAGSNAVIRPGAIVTGACIPLETAAKTGALTPQQARQLAANLAKTNPNMVSAANGSWVSYGEDGGRGLPAVFASAEDEVGSIDRPLIDAAKIANYQGISILAPSKTL